MAAVLKTVVPLRGPWVRILPPPPYFSFGLFGKVAEGLLVSGGEASVGEREVRRLHTLRHPFAGHLVMSGVDLPTVKKLMGHSDIPTTVIYAHLAEAVDKIKFQRATISPMRWQAAPEATQRTLAGQADNS